MLWPNGWTRDLILAYPGARAFGDVDGDGILDLIDEQGVRLGRGDGRFGIRTTAFRPPERARVTIASGDFNRDGLDDVIVGTFGLWLYFGTPEGTLRPAGRIEEVFFDQVSTTDPTIRVIDLDGDGELDLYGARNAGPFAAFGLGGGRFSEVPGNLFVIRSAVGDVNGDGRLDVVSVGTAGLGFPPPPEPPKRSIWVYLTRDGGFEDVRSFEVGGREGLEQGIELHDIDRDGHLDVLVGADYGVLRVFLGAGDGTFQQRDEDIALPFPNPFVTLHVEDIDEDGYSDLFVPYLYGDAVQHVYWGEPDGGFDFASPTEVTVFGVLQTLSIPRHATFRRPFVRGDTNYDGAVDLSDGIALLRGLFVDQSIVCGDAADFDDSGRVMVNDALLLFRYLFHKGTAPSQPFPEAGWDRTHDVLIAPYRIRQGDGQDLGCSRKTFYFWQVSDGPCAHDSPPDDCPYPSQPIRQIIDLETHTVVYEQDGD